jgi:hypothetical protein
MPSNDSCVDAMTPRCPAGVRNFRRVTRQLSQSLHVRNIPRTSFTTTAPQQTIENTRKCCSKLWILIHFIYWKHEDLHVVFTKITDYILNNVPALIRRWEFHIDLHSTFAPWLCSRSVWRMSRKQKQTNSVVSVGKRTIPTKWPPHIGEVIANFCG